MRRVARLLSYGGCAVAVLLVSKYHARFIADTPYDFTGSFRFTWAIGYIGVLAVATYAVGLPDQTRSRRQALWLSLVAAIAAVAVTSAVQFAVGDALLPRFVVFGSALFLIPWQVAVAGIARDGRDRDEDRDRVLLVGTPAEHVRIEFDLQIAPERSAALAATLTPVEASGLEPGDLPIIDLQRATRATVVVLDRYAQAEDRVIAQAAKLHESGVRVRTLQGFYEEWLGKLPLSELERASLFFDIGEVHRVRYSRLKRVMDIALGLVGVIVLAIVTPFVVLGDLVANRGPLMYRQTRVGKGGEHFTILKFRTMRELRAADAHTDWTAQNDPRITPFGNLLRRTHLDELPQVINILKGDLAIVGPRPEQPRYVEELSDKLPFYDLRHLVRPGLTGWAQVKYGYAGDERDALEKLQYEFFYLRHQDLTFDQRIVLRTLRSMVGGQGHGR